MSDKKYYVNNVWDVEKFLLGHQAILAVHPDGHNGTGNVHVHIVINSVRKYEGKKEH